MPTPDLVSTFLRPLNRADVQYMITGSVAATIYGEPRFTQDIDIVLSLCAADVARFADAFAATDFYCPPVEVLLEEGARPTGGHFNVFHHDSGWRADCYVAGTRALETWGMSNRRMLRIGDDIVSVAAAEYVIVSKLEYYAQSGSARHPEDIVRMLRVSGDVIDRTVIAEWARAQGVSTVWHEVEARARGES